MRNHDGKPMKVVVYFRQAGGAVAETYPLITHWAEDEAEQPVLNRPGFAGGLFV